MHFSKHKRFEAIIEPHYRDIYFFLLGKVKNKALAEDLTQNTMEKAWRKIDEIKKDGAARAWCFQVAQNEVNEYYRKSSAMKRSLFVEESMDDKCIDVIALQSDVLEKIIMREDGRMAVVALTNVKELYRTVLSMKLVSGLNLEEIAKILDTNSSTIRNRYARGLLQLRSEYEEISKGERDER